MSLILVVENEDAIRLNLQEILELADFSVITAPDGSTGLQLAKSKNPDLILCDIMMPGLSGYELLSALRDSSKYNTIPFIFITAKADRDDIRQGMGLGADDYITKPCQPAEIIEAVNARLKRHLSLNQAYLEESQKKEALQQEIKKNRTELENSQQLAEIRGKLLEKLSQDLRDPLSSINVAILMIKEAKTEEERQKYLSILKDAYSQQITLLQEVSSLQELLTVENTKLLRTYQLLGS